MTDHRIHGITGPGFEEVTAAFGRNMSSGLETGAGLCLYHHGRPVVDVWGGAADEAARRPWEHSTLAVLASPTKALVAGAALTLVERGVLELDRPIAAYWPEFAAEGKGAVTLRMLLAHRTGVVTLDRRPITYEALRTGRPIVEALAAARPEWVPDTAHGYHATTFGHLVSELVRRTTGLTVGRFFAADIAAPLGLDCHIGMPAAAATRLAATVPSRAEELMNGGGIEVNSELLAALADPESVTFRATIGSMALSGETAQDVLRVQLENPSYDGVANAASLARFFAALIGEVDGVRLIGPALTAEIRRPHSRGKCRTVLLETAWGLGVMVPDGPLFPADAGLGGAFGLSGASGSFAFADPGHDLAFAYVPAGGSQVIDRIDPRARNLVEAAYRSLAAGV